MAGKKFHQMVFIIKAVTTILMLSSFGTKSSGLKNLAGTNNFDIDKGLGDHMKCFWHVMCELEEPLEVKKSSDVLHTKVLEHYVAEILPFVPDFVRGFATVENARNSSLWLKLYQPTICLMSEDERKEFLDTLIFKLTQHTSDMCSNLATKAECETMEESSVVYHKMVKNMIDRKECTIADNNYS